MLHHPALQKIQRRTGPEASALGPLPPLVQRLYSQRGLLGVQEADLALERLPNPDLLSGMEALCQALLDALDSKAHLLVIGDYDADGATATCVALEGLRRLGFKNIGYQVPNRFTSGYGLGPDLVESAAQRGATVLLTVDTGISSLEGVEAANARGIRVLITDHHLPGPDLPKAFAIVNPNLPGDPFPSKALAGVGVMFYVLLGLRRRLRLSAQFEREGRPEPELASLLDLVALGTVADVVPLDQTNRILVRQGIERIRKGRARPGLAALIEASAKDPDRLRAQDLGFLIGPRLNAAGRLDDMSLGIECLLAGSMESARPMAQALSELNQARRRIEEDMKREARMQIESLAADEVAPPIPCLYHEDWHQGVVGIVASRIKERLHRPVIAFAPDENEPDLLKGSARSIPQIHIRDALADLAARRPGLILKFGGHAMAAGLTLRASRLDEFKAALSALAVERNYPLEDGLIVWSDGPLRPEELTSQIARQIEEAGPWGQNFPEPLFDGDFDVVSHRIVGTHHLKMSLRHAAGGHLVEAIAFNLETPARWLRCQRIRAVYSLELNVFRGRAQPQLRIESMTCRDSQPPEGALAPQST